MSQPHRRVVIDLTTDDEMGNVLTKFKKRTETIDLTADSQPAVLQQRALPAFSTVFSTPAAPQSTLSQPGRPSQISFGQATALGGNQKYKSTTESARFGTEEDEPGEKTIDTQPAKRQRTSLFPSNAQFVWLSSPSTSPEPSELVTPPAIGRSREPGGIDEDEEPQSGTLPTHKRQRTHSPPLLSFKRKRILSTAPAALSPFGLLGRTLQPDQPEVGRSARLAALGHSRDEAIVIDEDEEHATPPDPTPGEQDVAPWNKLVVFSDGCLLESCWGGCGVAYFNGGHWHGKAIALGNTPGGSYEAEARGVVAAFQQAAELLRPHHQRVEICTDHSGIVDAFHGAGKIQSYRESLLALIWVEYANLADRGVEVKLSWVRGHDVHAGNEMADGLARLGAEKSRGGYGAGGVWVNPSVGVAEVDRRVLLSMSVKAEIRSTLKAGTAEVREANRELRRERKMKMRLEKRRQGRYFTGGKI